MKTSNMLFIVFLSLQAHADWFCTEGSGRRVSENSFEICGVAEDQTESLARALAFDAAKTEFTKFCTEDVKCKTSSKSLELKRTECKKSPTGYKCYRMLEYTLTVELRRLTEAVSSD